MSEQYNYITNGYRYLVAIHGDPVKPEPLKNPEDFGKSIDAVAEIYRKEMEENIKASSALGGGQ